MWQWANGIWMCLWPAPERSLLTSLDNSAAAFYRQAAKHKNAKITAAEHISRRFVAFVTVISSILMSLCSSLNVILMFIYLPETTLVSWRVYSAKRVTDTERPHPQSTCCQDPPWVFSVQVCIDLNEWMAYWAFQDHYNRSQSERRLGSCACCLARAMETIDLQPQKISNVWKCWSILRWPKNGWGMIWMWTMDQSLTEWPEN